MKKAKQDRKLTLMYLSNDVIQNSKKKGPEYGKEFGSILNDVFTHVGEVCTGDDIFNRIYRILSIWEERGVYEPNQIKVWFTNLQTAQSQGQPKRKAEPEPPVKPNESVKKQKPEENKLQTSEPANGQKEETIKLSPKTTEEIECDPPEPEELIKVLQDLENSASSDAAVREKITNLPPEIAELSTLSKLTDKDQAYKLSLKVDDAIKLLNDYNARLADEMAVRKRLTIMLRDFQIEQKELLVHAGKRLEEYKEKLRKVKEMQVAVKDQLKKLPNLSDPLSSTPLPTAGDLFNLKR